MVERRLHLRLHLRLEQESDEDRLYSWKCQVFRKVGCQSDPQYPNDHILRYRCFPQVLRVTFLQLLPVDLHRLQVVAAPHDHGQPGWQPGAPAGDAPAALHVYLVDRRVQFGARGRRHPRRHHLPDGRQHRVHNRHRGHPDSALAHRLLQRSVHIRPLRGLC